MSSRNLGNNYVLAWKTGAGTHMTLVYLNNVKRGYEQERAKRLVDAFLAERGTPATIPLSLGPMATERCVSVKSEVLEQLQQALYDYLVSQGFSPRPLRPLHIDLRSQSTNVVNKSIAINDWLW